MIDASAFAGRERKVSAALARWSMRLALLQHSCPYSAGSSRGQNLRNATARQSFNSFLLRFLVCLVNVESQNLKRGAHCCPLTIRCGCETARRVGIPTTSCNSGCLDTARPRTECGKRCGRSPAVSHTATCASWPSLAGRLALRLHGPRPRPHAPARTCTNVLRVD